MLTGLYKPASGRIRFAGHDITGEAPFLIARLGIARNFQLSNLVDEMSVLDNVAAARAVRQGASLATAHTTGIRDRRRAIAHGHAMAVLNDFGLGGHAWRKAGDLPHSLRRRTEIARAVALEPRLLILDEPAAGLDATGQAELSRQLATLVEKGLTLLIIEHNMSFLLPLATRVICLDSGRLIAEGTPESVGNDARVIEAYLGTPAGAKVTF